MLSKAMQDAINEQIKNELYSAYLYLAMSHHYEEMNLGGFANWLKVQFAEEQGHALKFMDYIHERGGQVVLKAIDQPPASFGTNKEVFQQVLEHEKKVTSWIYKLYELALKENDYPTQLMLQWFINEQVEEEKNASEIIAYLDMIDAHDTAVLMLDHDLGKRKAGGD
jgi:ferritin